MKPYEIAYTCARPFLLPLHARVHRELKRICRTRPAMDLLDVGGRKSPYTVGLPAAVHISDLPRQTDIQEKLHLGINEPIIRQVQARRSNIRRVIYDDMTQSKLPAGSFDCVVAVEVLEHVERDRMFVSEVHRVLRPGGCFLMTTPNGDTVPNTNPDHKRHYRRRELLDLLTAVFPSATVECAVPGGRLHRWGLESFALRRPFRTARSMLSNLLVNARVFDSAASVDGGPRHLLAVAYKAAGAGAAR